MAKALKYFENAIALDQKKDTYFYNYANTLQAMGKFKLAIDQYKNTLAINPDNALAHNNLGIVLTEWDHFDEAKLHYKKAIELQPDFTDALHNLFQYYEANGETEQSSITLSQLGQTCPNNAHIELKQSQVFPLVTQSEKDIATCVKKLEDEIDKINPADLTLKEIVKYDLSFPSIAIYYGLDDVALRKKYAALFNSVIKPLPAHAKKPQGEKPNIAFIVTRGHEGVFIKCMAGLIKQLPATVNCTIVCSSVNGKLVLKKDLPDEHYLEIDKDIEEAAQQIYKQNFDILYYWEVGTDCTNYFLPYFKAARVQVGCWGWPSTSGIEAMDYFLSSESLESKDAENNYTEKLIKLARLPVYYYRPPVPEESLSKSHFGFQDEHHLYLCAQNLRKVQPQMDEVFIQILQQDEHAQVLFIDDKRENITQLLKDRLHSKCAVSGGSKNSSTDLFQRIHFISRKPAQEYLALVKTVDVILDTFHYTGGANTNYDAFAAATPVVTLPSALHRGCYTYAAYQQIDYLECVAKDASDYVRIAVALANDAAFNARASQAVLTGCKDVLEDQLAVDLFVENVFEICASL